MSEMKWEDPLPARGGAEGAAYWQEIAAGLRANPKRWAVIREDSLDAEDACTQLPGRIKRGVNAAFRPAGAFEATSRRDKATGTVKVYARYVGGGVS